MCAQPLLELATWVHCAASGSLTRVASPSGAVSFWFSSGAVLSVAGPCPFTHKAFKAISHKEVVAVNAVIAVNAVAAALSEKETVPENALF